jgi:hypothetical protein
MKITRKGVGISIHTSQVNNWKSGLANVSEGLPIVEFKPYKPPVHPRQDDMKAYAAIPSRFV